MNARPHRHYLALVAVFGTGVGAASVAVDRRVDPGDVVIPPWPELALAGLATHRVSRLVSKSKIATPLRAPFTERQGHAGPAEVNDIPVGSGWRRGVGELVSCPFCLDVWIATAFTFGRLLAPRATRTALTVAGSVAVADFLHFAYVIAEHRAEA